MSGPSRVRLAVLNRHFGKRFGGAEHYSVAIAEQLAPRYEVHVFAQEFDHQRPNINYHPVPCMFSKPRWLNQLWYSTATWWLTRRGYACVLSHENTWHGDIQVIHVRPFRAGLFHQRTGLRRWLKAIALFTSPRLLTYWWLEQARMRAQPHRCIVATSEAVKKDILEAYPAVASDISTITPGVSVPQEPLDRTSHRAQMRRALNLPDSGTVLLFVGNDYIKKGLPTLLQALANLPEVHLAVVGQTSHLASCNQLAQSLRIDQRVHFLGPLNKIDMAYVAADIFVHPTIEDTYAMVVLEAMAHGVPVVVSGPAHCGISIELKNHYHAMVLDDPRDIEGLSSAIQTLINSPQEMENLRNNAKRFAQDRSWSRAGHLYEALINKHLARP